MNEKPHPDAAKETCIKCGASVIPGDQYCDSCGAKIETALSCKKCGAQLEPDAQFCDSCGAKIETALSCKKCGAQLEPDVQFCDSCGAKIGEGKRAVPSEPSNQEPTPTTLPNIIQQEPPVSPSTQKKSPGLALIASFFIPGLGQIYNGKTAKGFAIFFGSLIGSFIFLIPGLIVWIYGMFDAYSTANKMNNGEIPFVAYKKIYMIILIIIWLVILAIVLLILYYTFMIFLPAYTATTTQFTSDSSTAGHVACGFCTKGSLAGVYITCPSGSSCASDNCGCVDQSGTSQQSSRQSPSQSSGQSSIGGSITGIYKGTGMDRYRVQPSFDTNVVVVLDLKQSGNKIEVTMETTDPKTGQSGKGRISGTVSNNRITLINPEYPPECTGKFSYEAITWTIDVLDTNTLSGSLESKICPAPLKECHLDENFQPIEDPMMCANNVDMGHYGSFTVKRQ